MAAKTRLNKDMRDLAITALIKHAYVEKPTDWLRRESELAYAARDERCTSEQLAIINSLPREWLNTDGYIYVSANGWSCYLDFYSFDNAGVSNGMPEGVKCEQTFVPPTRDRTVSAELGVKIQAFLAEKSKFEEDQKNVMAMIRSTIASFTHLETMLEAIPDLITLEPALIGWSKAPSSAMIVSAERMLCAIAKIRGDERDGCCDGKRTVDIEVIAKAA